MVDLPPIVPRYPYLHIPQIPAEGISPWVTQRSLRLIPPDYWPMFVSPCQLEELSSPKGKKDIPRVKLLPGLLYVPIFIPEDPINESLPPIRTYLIRMEIPHTFLYWHIFNPITGVLKGATGAPVLFQSILKGNGLGLLAAIKGAQAASAELIVESDETAVTAFDIYCTDEDTHLSYQTQLYLLTEKKGYAQQLS